MYRWGFCLTSIVMFVPNPLYSEDSFAFRDGDTVVFLGDSITAARTYGKIIENYTLLRFPDRKIRFINSGRGGDTAAGGLKRLEKDVFAHQATVLIVAYGVNDIGWGLKADDDHKKAYLDGIRGIVTECKKRKVRVFIGSAAITAEDPATAENGFLQKMCDEGMVLSRSLGEGAIDIQRKMRTIQKRIWEANKNNPDKDKHETLHTKDGVHLNDLGQLAMAFAILKELGASADVSSVTIDWKNPDSGHGKNCTLSEVKKTADGLTFIRLDQGLPFNYGIFYGLNYRFIPVPNELNRYMLTVTNLPHSRYEVKADDRSAGTFTSQQLAIGVNIASTTADPWQPGGPWNAQANLLKSLTDARHEISIGALHAGIDLPKSSATKELSNKVSDFDKEVVQMQRIVAKPQPYHFVIKRVEASKEKNQK